jgi:nitrate/nitrite transporter NarK
MRHVVLGFLCLIAVIAYVQRTGINSASGVIQDHFRIDTRQFGTLGAAWLLGYAIMQVPAGWLADRWGSRRTLIVLATAWSVVTATVGLCPDFPSLLAQWFVMGMALAGVFPCAAKSIGAWFPDTQKATASALLGCAMTLGAVIASALTSWLVAERGWTWQATYALYGAAGVLWAVAYALAVPERAESRVALAAMSRGDWRRLAESSSMWLVCGQQFFRAGAMIFFLNWFPKFLGESRGLTDLQAGVFASYANLSGLFGGLLGGFFSDWLFRRTGRRRLSRQGIAALAMTASGLLIVATYFITGRSAAVLVFSIAAFVAGFGGVSGYTVTIEFGGRRVATVFSVMNASGNLGAALFAYLAGLLRERTGDWSAALFLSAGAFAAAALCFAFLDHAGPPFGDEAEILPEEPSRAPR